MAQSAPHRFSQRMQTALYYARKKNRERRKSGGITPPIPWTPLDLGAKLLGWWDAEDATTLTMAGSAVSEWRDKVHGLAAMQATSSFRPIYQSAGINGRPALLFDASDDRLETTTNPLLVGAAPGEMWGLVNQAALGSETANRGIIFLGNTATGIRLLARVGSGGVNRAGLFVTPVPSSPLIADPVVDFSGVKVGRLICTSTLSTIQGSRTTSTSVSAVPTTANTLVRLGRGSSATWSGSINTILATALLTLEESDKLYVFLNTRGGI